MRRNRLRFECCLSAAWVESDLETGETMRPSDAGRTVETFPTRVDCGVVVIALPCLAASHDLNSAVATGDAAHDRDAVRSRHANTAESHEQP